MLTAHLQALTHPALRKELLLLFKRGKGQALQRRLQPPLVSILRNLHQQRLHLSHQRMLHRADLLDLHQTPLPPTLQYQVHLPPALLHYQVVIFIALTKMTTYPLRNLKPNIPKGLILTPNLNSDSKINSTNCKYTTFTTRKYTAFTYYKHTTFTHCKHTSFHPTITNSSRKS